jgi:hypothetical protein
MSSAEEIGRRETDKTWTYDTPYDVVQRRKTIKRFGASSLRAAHVDAYINYINNEMESGYVIATYIDVDRRFVKNGSMTKNSGTQIYRPNEQGKYDRYAHYVVDGADTMFFGNKIILDRQDVVVLNTEVELGISPTRSIKMMPVKNPDIYLQKEMYQKNRFGLMVGVMKAIEKGDRYYDWDELVIS